MSRYVLDVPSDIVFLGKVSWQHAIVLVEHRIAHKKIAKCTKVTCKNKELLFTKRGACGNARTSARDAVVRCDLYNVFTLRLRRNANFLSL